MIKRFIQDLRRMLHVKQKELVVAVTHLEKCDKTLSAEACKRVYERELGIGKGNVVVLSATHRVPPYAMKAWPGLDGSIVDEQSATDGVYLEPRRARTAHHYAADSLLQGIRAAAQLQ